MMLSPTAPPCIVNDVIDWIEANIHRPLSANAVADKAGYSRAHFMRMFKKMTGQTLVGYVRARQLTVVLGMITDNDAQVDMLVEQFGWSSHSTFCRAFQDQFGLHVRDVRQGMKPPAETLQYRIDVLPEHFEVKVYG